MDFLRIGVVSRPQGIKGELKVSPLTDDPARFEKLSRVFAESAGYKPYEVEGVSVRGNDVFVRLKDITDRNGAEAMRGEYLCVGRQDAVQLPPGRYFISDIIGCRVLSDEGEDLGELEDVLQYPANDVYVVMKDNKRFLVPALKKLMISVDIAQKRIVFNTAVLSEVMVRDED